MGDPFSYWTVLPIASSSPISTSAVILVCCCHAKHIIDCAAILKGWTGRYPLLLLWFRHLNGKLIRRVPYKRTTNQSILSDDDYSDDDTPRIRKESSQLVANLCLILTSGTVFFGNWNLKRTIEESSENCCDPTWEWGLP